MLKNTKSQYGSIAKLFHWLMFIIIACLIGVGLYMVDLPDTPDKFELYALHKSFGATVLMLVALRLLWRLANTTPTLPNTLNNIQKFAAHVSHFVLYLMMIIIPLSGWLMSNSFGYKVEFFGLFELPNIAEKNKEVGEFFNLSHQLLAYVLIGLLVIHIGAALFHHFKLKDSVLSRILPFSKNS